VEWEIARFFTEEEVRLASLSIANPSSLKEISIDLKCKQGSAKDSGSHAPDHFENRR
jgi:hypothetical protein